MEKELYQVMVKTFKKHLKLKANISQERLTLLLVIKDLGKSFKEADSSFKRSRFERDCLSN